MNSTAPIASHAQQLGEDNSIWFQLMPLMKGGSNPMAALMKMGERYGGVIAVNMGGQRVVMLTKPEHFKRDRKSVV